MTIFGLGFSFLHSPLLGAVTKILPPRHAGIGLGMFMTIFLLGAAFGIATSITALELQADDAPSWLGLSLGGGAPFSNATLVLSALSLLGLLLVPWLSGKDPRPPGE